MNILLNLPIELQKELKEEANKKCLTLSAYIRLLLLERNK